MAINSVVQNYVSSLLAGEALAPSAPAISAPNPFVDDDRADIGFQKFGTRIVDRDLDSDLSTAASTRRESDSDTKGYSGPLDVSRIYRQQGTALPEQGFFDQALGGKPIIDPITGAVSYGAPRGLSFFPGGIGALAAIGGGLSRRNLERIYKKVQAGEEGFGLAMLNGRVVGVEPGPMEGSTVLSGVLPEGLTSQQRYQLGQNILAAGAPTDEPAPPTPSFEEQVAQYAASGESPDGSSSLLSGGNINIVQDSDGRPVTSGGKPVTTSAGQYVDPALLQAQADAMRAAAQQDRPSTQPAPAPAPKPDPIDQNLYGDRGGGDRGGSDRGGSGQAGTGSGPGERFRASGGTVGFAEGGNTQKDPIQRTGFVEGPPQEYAKGTTVADTENLRVREGSFVINAPMTEKLQKAGVLPKGNQKRKAAKGGKMMEVALSKGEYVVEPKDVPKFGGYNFLEAVNDMGKPEVERRQAAAQGGFLDGYATGGELPLTKIDLDDSTKTKFNTFLKSRRQRADVENLIDSMDDRERLAVLALAETTADTDPIESMMGVGQTAINRAKSNRRDFSKVNDLAEVMKQRSSRGSGSKMFQYDGLEPGVLSRRLAEVVKGQVPRAVTKMFSAADNLLNPETESDPILPFDVMFYTTPDAPLARDFERNPLLRYTKSFGGHDYYALDAASEN